MNDPVVTVDGHTYEKRAIKLWLKKHNTSPLTNVPLKSKKLVPNITLKKQIQDYKEKAQRMEIDENKNGLPVLVRRDVDMNMDDTDLNNTSIETINTSTDILVVNNENNNNNESSNNDIVNNGSILPGVVEE